MEYIFIDLHIYFQKQTNVHTLPNLHTHKNSFYPLSSIQLYLRRSGETTRNWAECQWETCKSQMGGGWYFFYLSIVDFCQLWYVYYPYFKNLLWKNRINKFFKGRASKFTAAPLPEKDHWRQKKKKKKKEYFQRILRKRKGGSKCWFWSLIWLKPRGLGAGRVPGPPSRASPLDRGFTTSRIRVVPLCNFVAFCEIGFFNHNLKTNKVKFY